MTDVPKHLQIRNVPDDVHAVLIERAASAGQSLQEYMLARLIDQARTKTNAEIMDEIEGQMTAHPERFTTTNAGELIRIDRDSH